MMESVSVLAFALFASLNGELLGSLPFGHRRENLTVPALLRFPLLAENQITGVQTIPFVNDTLYC